MEQPEPPKQPAETSNEIPYEEFYGATAEAGDPAPVRHPFVPDDSRAAGDLYVHYVTYTQTDQDVIQLWFPESPKTDVMPVDYEILEARVTLANGKTVDVNDDVAIELMLRVFFQETTLDFYADRISAFSFQRLGSGEFREVPYPTAN